MARSENGFCSEVCSCLAIGAAIALVLLTLGAKPAQAQTYTEIYHFTDAEPPHQHSAYGSRREALRNG